MGVRAQYQFRRHHVHSLSAQLTAAILTHLATQTPTIPGRHKTKPTRLPGFRTLFANCKRDDAMWSPDNTTLPPLHSAVQLDGPISCLVRQSVVTKATVGSPTSPSMTAAAPITPPVHVVDSSAASLKTRRPLSLQDLLCVETAPTHCTKRLKSIHHRRQCGIADCFKYALTGGFCIRHGGGKRCSFDGCQTVAQSGGRCKAHGGGSKCKVSGCGSVARRKGFCMSHGGRQQCKVEGCNKCAHGGGLCISHGGGKRCAAQLCAKSAQAGGFCYSHGGGKRCAAPECFQAARKGGLCIRHRKAAVVQ